MLLILIFQQQPAVFSSVSSGDVSCQAAAVAVTHCLKASQKSTATPATVGTAML